MSIRVDTSSWIPGAIVCGDRGFGVLGSEIPSTGDNGAGYVYNDLSLPADASKEICGRITTWPSAGTLYAYEDTSFEFTGAPDGSYTFAYQLYVDGVATGSPTTVYIQVGSPDASFAITTDSTTFSGTGKPVPVASLSVTTEDTVFSGTATQVESPEASFAITLSGTVVSGIAQSGLFTQEQLDFLLTYIQENLVVPTVEEIAAAVLAAMNAAPPKVNLWNVRSQDLVGDGSATPWGPA